MSLDFQTVKQQITDFSVNAANRVRRMETVLAAARTVLTEHASQPDAVRARMEAAARIQPNLVCALPTGDALDAVHPLPALPSGATLLAADGSQIFPDRHGQVLYGLVNVGAITFRHGSRDAPRQTVDSRLLSADETFGETERITDRLVAVLRDLGERELLAELARGLEPPLITLTDGQLELWDAREGGMGRADFDQFFEAYLGALEALRRLGASTAGYIDKPGSDQLVRTLEVMALGDGELRQAGQQRPFQGLLDVDLLKHLLGVNQRSAIFRSLSAGARRYHEQLAIHFFYLRVGEDIDGSPYLVRIEIPAWVAASPGMVNDLHALLIDQCQALGSRPYPYLLHRAHEVALVTLEEQEQVEGMIVVELRKLGVPVPPRSFKSIHKRIRAR